MQLKNNVRGFAMTLAAAALMISSYTASAAEEPDATVTIKETEVGIIISGDWGHGTLDFKGEKRLFHMGGGKIGGAGVTVSHVTGDVYHMQSFEDFPGIYFKAEAGITGVKGVGGQWIKNDKGVSIHLKENPRDWRFQSAWKG
jgi:hypothetical protein